jgi:hypothetical protein
MAVRLDPEQLPPHRSAEGRSGMDIQLDKALADIARIRRQGEATASDLADAPLLEGWIGVGAFLAGHVHGHPLWSSPLTNT